MTQSELCILLHLSFSLCFHNIIFWNFITDLENMFFHWNGFSFSSRDLLSLPQQTIQEVKIWNCFSCSFHRLHCQQGQILLIANAVPMQDWHPGSIILGIWRHTLGPHCTKGLCPCFSTPGSPTQHVCVSWNLPSQLTPLPHGNMLVPTTLGDCLSEGWETEMYWEGASLSSVALFPKVNKSHAMNWSCEQLANPWRAEEWRKARKGWVWNESGFFSWSRLGAISWWWAAP